jgi:parallel beta-helix repeat protein
MRARRLAVLALFVSIGANAAVFTVTNTNDSGAGSLRQALSDAAASSGAATVAFNLPSTPAKIMLLSRLPAVSVNTTVDATTQPGYAGKPLIEIDGSFLPALTTALSVAGALKGVAIGNCTYVAMETAGAAVISQNYIGLDSTGTVARPNGLGVYMLGPSNVTANVISGSGYGIRMTVGGSVTSNVIGLNAAQTAALANSTGIDVAYNNPPGEISNNVIAGNTGDGISLFYANNVVVTQNRIGSNGFGSTFPNGVGIEVYQSSSNTLGDGNIISNNRAYGILMTPTSVRNVITRNSIYNNGQLGIELSNVYPYDGPTANDPGDADSGPNGLQNYPIITHATAGAGVTITGSLSSTPNSTYTVEFFLNASCHGSGFGEGKTFVGSTSVTTDGSGTAPFNVNFSSAAASPGMVVTATATDALGNTSEFSRCALVEGPGQFSMSAATASIGEGNTSVTLNVVRTGGTIGTVTVDYATANGTATAGSDYTAKSGTLTLADGEASKSISIPILDDAVYEGNETFSVTLSNATGGATIGAPANTTVTIVDNEAPPSINSGDIRVTEGNSGTTAAVFTLTLSSASVVPASVQWVTGAGSASPGSDFQSASGTVTFNPGETQKTITVLVNGDTLYEPDESFFVFLFSASGATLNRSTLSCTIVNDDAAPTITADDVRVIEGNSGTTAAVVTLKASQPLTGYLEYYTVAGSAIINKDFNYVYGSVYFSNETQKQITIQIIGDTDVEPDETFQIHLVPYSYYGYALARTDITVTIVNDDVGMGPSRQTIAKGSSGQLVVDVGVAQDTPQTLAVVASDSCIKTPSSVVVPAGMHTALIGVQAVSAPCSTRVDVTLPPALGGKTLSAGIQTFVPLALTFDPPSPKIWVGQTINVHVTASPLDGAVAMPIEALGGTVKVPASVNVDANGGTFTVKGLKAGPLVVFVTLPAQNGGGTAILDGEVDEVPSTVTIAQLTPNSGPTAGSTSVALVGVNFQADCTLLFGGIPATNVVYVNSENMTASTPAHAAGAVDVAAICGAESFNLPNGFTYLGAAPEITAVTPSFGSTRGGTTVRISGHDFAPDCWAFFDGVGARNVSVDGTTEMIATTQPHAAGTVAVSVRCRGNVQASLPQAFSYSTAEEPAPVVTSIDPSAAAPDQSVTINGSRFRISDSVTFDAAAAAVLGTTPDAHVVTVPALPLGKSSINVTDANGHVSTTGPIFTVLEAVTPQVTNVAPRTLSAGGELTIDGNGFRVPYSFTVGDLAARTVTLSYTHAVVRVPALAPGTYELHVVNGSGQTAALGGNVTIVAGGVVVTGATPVCHSSDGGTTITIAGSGFANGASVTIGGAAATNVTVVDDGHITATVPPQAPGWAKIVVTNSDGSSATATNAIRVYSPYDPDGCGVAARPHTAKH